MEVYQFFQQAPFSFVWFVILFLKQAQWKLFANVYHEKTMEIYV